MPFRCDLLAVAPLIPLAEARTKDEISSVIRGLRGTKGWVKEGMTILGIRREIDPDFIRHQTHYERMIDGGKDDSGNTIKGTRGIRAVRFEAEDGVARVTIDGSREWKKGAHVYETRIQFNNYDRVRKHPGMSWTERARLLLRDHVQIHCTCEAYRYYHQYAATQKGFALVAEDTPADQKNPHNRGGVCKHIDHALRWVGGNYTSIASAMKNHLAAEESAVTVNESAWTQTEYTTKRGKGGKVVYDATPPSATWHTAIARAGLPSPSGRRDAAQHMHTAKSHVERSGGVFTVIDHGEPNALWSGERANATYGIRGPAGKVIVRTDHRGVVTHADTVSEATVGPDYSTGVVQHRGPASGMLQMLDDLVQQATKAGMSRTASFLKVARNAATTEGASKGNDPSNPTVAG